MWAAYRPELLQDQLDVLHDQVENRTSAALSPWTGRAWENVREYATQDVVIRCEAFPQPTHSEDHHMGSQLNPCLAFNGNARQAMEFYRDVLGGELEMGTYADFGSSDAPADRIMHATLRTPDGYTLMGWDVRDGMLHTPGNSVAVFLGGDDAVLRDRFERLSAGGTVTLPLDKQLWGDEAGSLVDRFGITWMVNITQRP